MSLTLRVRALVKVDKLRIHILKSRKFLSCQQKSSNTKKEKAQDTCLIDNRSERTYDVDFRTCAAFEWLARDGDDTEERLDERPAGDRVEEVLGGARARLLHRVSPVPHLAQVCK